MTLNRYELILNNLPENAQNFNQTFAHFAHDTRISWQAPTEHEQVIWNTGCNVIGPLYTEFVSWLLNTAENDGIKRLYFMARDGLILKEIADLFIAKNNLKIKTHYLYVSRQSLLNASIVDIDNFDIRWIMWNPFTPLSIKTILKRAGISFDDVKTELAEYNITDIQRPLSFIERIKFRRFFRKPHVIRIIVERAQKQNETTIAYLKQEGLGDSTPFGLVDIGWIALSQYALSRMLDKEGCRPREGLKGYYLGTNWLLWKYRNDNAQSFLYNAKNMLSRMPLVQYELPEIFATADHGRTLGYERQNNIIIPIFGETNLKAKEWGSDLQTKSTLAFAKNIISNTQKDYWKGEDNSKKIGKVFDLFCNQPSLAEANVYGSFTHGADIEEKEGREIAPVIGYRDLIKVITGYYWVQGSVRRSKWFCRIFWIHLFTLVNTLRHVLLNIVDLKLKKTL